LGKLGNAPANLAKVVREICTTEVEPDGLVFNSASVESMRIKEDADDEGVRVRFEGLLGKAKAPMQLDVGFGDVVMARGARRPISNASTDARPSVERLHT
jgi:hypothetical protein